ncbi:MAG: DNA repair protein RecN [Meiothermus sp.]
MYQNLYQSLEPLLGAKTQSILEEGVRRLGVDPDRLDVGQAESILKRLVYRELQANRSPAEARGLVDSLLKELREQAGTEVGGGLAALESGFKRFSLYLDWPEVARLRGILSVLRKEPEGAEASRMLREGQELLQQLEERLQSALLRQTRDIADLQAVFERVKMIGGPKIRRLDSLIRQIQEAHSGETLAQAEVERARTLAAELRKLVESSAISAPRNATEPALFVEDEDEPVVAAEPLVETDAPEAVTATGEAWDIVIDLDSLSQEQQTRIREIDLAEDRRRLETLKERYAAVLARAGVAEELARLEGELAQGNLLGEALGAFEERLKAAQAEALSEARRAAARNLSAKATQEIRFLGMPEARFEVGLVPLNEPGPEGLEEVQLLFSANPGQGLAPLEKAASGGELSRVMLALALLTGSEADTVVFDEVDAGVGGEAAWRVAERLAQLAQRRQVLVVTHLPQIAAQAQQHYRVVKNKGRVEIQALGGEERVRELARMLSGSYSDAAMQHARELLQAR